MNLLIKYALDVISREDLQLSTYTIYCILSNTEESGMDETESMLCEKINEDNRIGMACSALYWLIGCSMPNYSNSSRVIAMLELQEYYEYIGEASKFHEMQL